MVNQIRLDQAKQADLEGSIKKMEVAAGKVESSLKNLVNQINDSLKGKSADALNDAVDDFQSKIEKARENWSDMTEQVSKIAEGIRKADEDLAKK